MHTISEEVEIAGFAKNNDSGEYELMFSTIIGSPKLAKAQTAEKVEAHNAYYGREKYDIYTIKIMQRKTVTLADEWAELVT